MKIELQNNLKFGLGFYRANYPLARHYVARCGRFESRAIVDKNNRTPLMMVFLLTFALGICMLSPK